LFCFVRHIEIFQPTTLHATLFMFLKISQWITVHQLSLKLFGTMVRKLLIIKPFFQWKININKIEIVLEFGVLLVLLENLQCLKINIVYFTILKVKMLKLLIIKPFFQWKLNKIKILLEFGGVLGKLSMTQN
jgi:hypothetical protein